METLKRVCDGLVIVRLKGCLAASPQDTELEAFRLVLADLLRRGHLDIAINLADVSVLDAEGLGELAHAFTHVSRLGGRLALVAPPERVRRLLSVTKLDTIFTLFGSDQEAVEQLASRVAPGQVRSTERQRAGVDWHAPQEKALIRSWWPSNRGQWSATKEPVA